MLAGTGLDRVSSINDFGVIINQKTNFLEHVDVMGGKTFVIRNLSEDCHSSSEIHEL
jgi:hypothetical protein